VGNLGPSEATNLALMAAEKGKSTGHGEGGGGERRWTDTEPKKEEREEKNFRDTDCSH